MFLPPAGNMVEGIPAVSKDLVFSMTKPVVFHGMIADWDVLNWTIEDWTCVFGDTVLPFRCGEKFCSPQPLWERNCSTEEMTVKQFADLNRNPTELKDSGKWFYFDYKHFHEWLPDKKDMLKSINWSHFGFPDMGADESTFWMGSIGAHTPCHYDTYGCNLVAQVLGTKRWLLFPPDESKNMKLTRIPYEESSVYSGWNFNCPLPDEFYLGSGHVYIIDLRPGDVLFVPRHWWHYVECLEPSISVNAWIPTSQDDDSRLDEALVRLTMSHMSSSVSSSDRKIMLNPNEDYVPRLEIHNCTNIIVCSLPRERKESEAKHQVLNSDVDELDFAAHVPCCSTDQLKSVTNQKCNCNSKIRHQSLMRTDGEKSGMLFKRTESVLHKVINAYCHPDVICKVREKLVENW